jgi:hypothetical protein
MFETKLPPVADLNAAEDAAVLADIVGWAGVEAQATARRLLAVAELVHRRCGSSERARWACDEWDGAAAELSAALGISHRRASGQMYEAVGLRNRLPQLAALFMSGGVSNRVVSAVVWRTDLVGDRDALELIDRAIAERAGQWGALSQSKLDQAIDAVIDRHDPGALRRTQGSARSRDVTFGGQDPETGTSSMWARLLGADAAILERRLAQMAHAVCDDDPRTIAQRRADALGALGAGATQLACQCGDERCPSAVKDERAGAVVIHVLADAEALQAEPDPMMSGEGPPRLQPITRNTPLAELMAPESGGELPPPCPGRAVIAGGPAIPAPLLAQLVAGGATVRHVRQPALEPEPGYRPSAALQAFVRMRDLTCRFPMCDVPADQCDIDHAIPWPLGPTHPSNLRCECRKHHLLKTFWVGVGGWSDRQDAAGIITWIAPTGRAYTTRPGSRVLFPDWNTDTGPLPGHAPPATGGSERGEMMPTRRRTRAAERLRRIAHERSYNDAHVAERNLPPPF